MTTSGWVLAHCRILHKHLVPASKFLERVSAHSTQYSLSRALFVTGHGQAHHTPEFQQHTLASKRLCSFRSQAHAGSLQGFGLKSLYEGQKVGCEHERLCNLHAPVCAEHERLCNVRFSVSAEPALPVLSAESHVPEGPHENALDELVLVICLYVAAGCTGPPKTPLAACSKHKRKRKHIRCRKVVKFRLPRVILVARFCSSHRVPAARLSSRLRAQSYRWHRLRSVYGRSLGSSPADARLGAMLRATQFLIPQNCTNSHVPLESCSWQHELRGGSG